MSCLILHLKIWTIRAKNDGFKADAGGKYENYQCKYSEHKSNKQIAKETKKGRKLMVTEKEIGQNQ